MMNDQAPAPAPSELGDPNQHIYEYLRYYTDFAEPPRYAVLIDGPWGVGKTHLVNRFLASRSGEQKQKFVYISLFGLKSTRDIDDALYAQAHPLLASKTAQVAGRVIKTLLKHKGIDIDGQFDVQRFLANTDFALYVFDDLERSNMDINEVLGYINEFVEHDGCKVVLLANEKEIEKNEAYRKRREKIVGKTLRVHSAFHEALEQFLSPIADQKLKAFLSSQREEIAHLYTASTTDNLRALQQTIWDFERLYGACSEAHRGNTPAMVALLRLFFPLSFEFKTGRMDSTQLLDRATGLMFLFMNQNDSEEVGFWKVLRDRYAGVDLLDGVLSSEVLESILAKGHVPTKAIRTCLDESPFFASERAEPSWQTVWYFYERTDELFKAALADMEAKFGRQEYTRYGEILHVFGLRLWLASERMISPHREEAFQQCKAYVDALKASGKLVPMATRFDARDRHEEHGGLGYHEGDRPDFQELAQYLNEQSVSVFNESLPAQAGNLLKLLNSNLDQFASQISNPYVEEGESFYNTPILAAMGPGAFIGALDSLAPYQQKRVLLSLSARYAHGRLSRDLPSEVAWLRSVKALLEDPEDQSVFAQKRRTKFVEWFIDPILKDVLPTEPPPKAVGDTEDVETD
jgi:GTPase SAR1 family protein